MAAESLNGLFRANPDAVSPNNIRLVDPTTPGTAAQDNVTWTVATTVAFDGITYTGKDAVTRFIPFFVPDGKTNQQVQQSILFDSGAAALQAAIRRVLEMHEVDPIITIDASGGSEWDIRHVGSGTVVAVYRDGVAINLARTAL